MAQYRLITMLRKTFEAQKEKALMTFELLMENPAGIVDHSTEDFYKSAEEAAKALTEAEDVLETLTRHFSKHD
jgi:flagellar motor switch protein FliG